MRCRGKGDAIPLLAVQDALRLAAGSFTYFPKIDIENDNTLKTSLRGN
jgi:hypothetical protein